MNRKFMKLPQTISFVLSFFLLTSCYESLDFDQIDDYVYEPIFTSALTYFSVSPFQFFNSMGIQENEITHIDDFQAFQRDFVRNSVVKVDFNVQVKNEFDRNVSITFEFLNNNMEAVYSTIEIFVDRNNLTHTFLEEIVIADHPEILNASFVRAKATVEDTGTPMDPNDTSEFEFKSSITLYIKSEL